jgi:hypothetical protein
MGYAARYRALADDRTTNREEQSVATRRPDGAVKRFLKREARFVRVARHRTRAGAHSGLTTFISVGSSEEIPVGLELSAPLLALLAKAGVTWTVTASVFADGSRPDVGEGAPSKR